MSNLPYTLFRFLPRQSRGAHSVFVQTYPLEFGKNTVELLLFIESKRNLPSVREQCLGLSNSVAREFAKHTNKSLIDALETTLKQANTLLLQLGQSLSDELLDFKVTVAVLRRQELHFSCANGAGIFLLRDGKVRPIGEEPETSAISFSALTSGSLGPGDRILIGNAELISAIATVANEPLQSDQELVERLAKLPDLSLRNEIAGFYIGYTPDDPQDQTVYLDTYEAHTPLSLPSYRINFSAAGANVSSLISSAKSVFGSLRDRLSNGASVRHYQAPKIGRLFTRRTAIIGGVIVVVVIGAFIMLHRRATPSAQGTASVDLAAQLQQVAPDKTAQFLQTQVTLGAYNGLDDTAKQELQSAALTRNYAIEALPSVVSELPAAPVAMDTADGDIFIVDQTGQLWRWENNQLVKEAQASQISNPISLAAFAKNNILVSDAAGNVWQLDGTSASPTQLALPSGLKSNPKLLQRYGANLYLIDQADNTVSRVTNFTKDLSSAASYTKSSTLKFNKVLSWTITGNLTAIDQDGKVGSWLRNQTTPPNFSITTGQLPNHIVSDGTTIYIASGNFLLSYNQGGSVITQTYYPAESPLSSVIIASDGVYFTSGTRLYRLPSN